MCVDSFPHDPLGHFELWPALGSQNDGTPPKMGGFLLVADHLLSGSTLGTDRFLFNENPPWV